MMGRHPEYPCLFCNREVKENDEAVECENCCRWQHLQCGVAIDLKNYLEAVDEGSEISWLCWECKVTAEGYNPKARLTRSITGSSSHQSIYTELSEDEGSDFSLDVKFRTFTNKSRKTRHTRSSSDNALKRLNSPIKYTEISDSDEESVVKIRTNNINSNTKFSKSRIDESKQSHSLKNQSDWNGEEESHISTEKVARVMVQDISSKNSFGKSKNGAAQRQLNSSFNCTESSEDEKSDVLTRKTTRVVVQDINSKTRATKFNTSFNYTELSDNEKNNVPAKKATRTNRHRASLKQSSARVNGAINDTESSDDDLPVVEKVKVKRRKASARVSYVELSEGDDVSSGEEFKIDSFRTNSRAAAKPQKSTSPEIYKNSSSDEGSVVLSKKKDNIKSPYINLNGKLTKSKIDVPSQKTMSTAGYSDSSADDESSVSSDDENKINKQCVTSKIKLMKTKVVAAKSKLTKTKADAFPQKPMSTTGFTDSSADEEINGLSVVEDKTDLIHTNTDATDVMMKTVNAPRKAKSLIRCMVSSTDEDENGISSGEEFQPSSSDIETSIEKATKVPASKSVNISEGNAESSGYGEGVISSGEEDEMNRCVISKTKVMKVVAAKSKLTKTKVAAFPQKAMSTSGFTDSSADEESNGLSVVEDKTDLIHTNTEATDIRMKTVNAPRKAKSSIRCMVSSTDEDENGISSGEEFQPSDSDIETSIKKLTKASASKSLNIPDGNAESSGYGEGVISSGEEDESGRNLPTSKPDNALQEPSSPGGFTDSSDDAVNDNSSGEEFQITSKTRPSRSAATSQRYNSLIIDSSGVEDSIASSGEEVQYMELCGEAQLRQEAEDGNSVKFPCKICDKNLSSKEVLDRHMLIHVGVKPYACKICDKRFGKNWDVKEHMKIHTGATPYVCETCGKQFTRLAGYKGHMRTHTGEKPYQCKVCDRCFISSGLLVKHERTHTGERPFPCTVCGKAFKSRHTCSQHEKLHDTSGKTYVCEVCEKQYDNENSLKIHRRSHNKNRPHICQLCDKAFSTPKCLSRHIITHTSEKRYPCPICGRRFGRSDQLKKHVRMHYGETEKYSCRVCGKLTSSLNSFNNHERSHTGLKPFRCGICDRTFNSRSTLKKHGIVHTGEKPHKCKHCNKSFGRLYGMKEHMKTHTGARPFKCETCGKAFGTVSILRMHEDIHLPVKPYPCKLCDKSFTQAAGLVRHVRLHTGEKPFKCNICGELFHRDDTLLDHKRKHEKKELHTCETCGKQYSLKLDLKRHITTHMEDRPHSCEICEMSFPVPSSLKKHVKLVHGPEKSYNCIVCDKAFSRRDTLAKHKKMHVVKPFAW